MKNSIYKIIAIAVITFSCQNSSENQVDTVEPELAFDKMLENYHEERLQLFPLDATFAGDTRYNHILPNNLTERFKLKLTDFYTTYLEALESYEKSSLSEDQRMSYEVLKWECEMNLKDLNFPMDLMPIDQMWSMNLMFGQLASGSSAQPFNTFEDYENWLKRVDQYIAWGDSAIANMKKGIEQNVVLPKPLIKKVIPQIESLAKGPYNEHLFYSPAKNFPSEFSEDQKTALSESYKNMVEGQIIPLYSRMAEFFNNQYLEAGRETTGIDALPFGKEYYQHQIKKYTTTDMTADEVFQLGKDEVARISKEMEKVKEQVGFKGDLKSFFNHVRTKPELMPFTEPEEVIANFNAIHEKMKPQLSQLFDKTPKTPFQVKRTEAFREASASAEYNQGSKDGSRPGTFYVPIPDVEAYNMYSDESLFLHEAIPGHHYQISLQQENENLPEFRRTLWYSAYGEGWALYSESLGKELGLYTDPYQYFGMLGAEMHRAIRLVVDAGMHSQGWTREQAIQYSLENEAESEESIEREIERYMANPGQALSYKVGQLKIIELRKKAQEAMGEKFDIKQFHNIVLETGCIPLKLLEEKVEAYINN
ncbi:DUF885 domain-containing protein [Fulvivirga lutea]|uniref:DUF885 domain-containing protein n=1 Tax=Fulvivirga lutea TaxID=2810512 RepID=A0A974WGK9_9BACT|nr:DUF885 domain-containing protein [Fulvivirga lutea]QSE98128.1 DUF885 domain-containing protein [Fulvivirga lutea]